MSCVDTSACFDMRGEVVSRFCWLAPGEIPAHLDLRQCGWTLSGCDQPCEGCIGIFPAAGLDSMEWMRILSSFDYETRKYILVAGVEPAHERTTLLQIGFGDAVSLDVSIEELEARASRIAETSRWLPRSRKVGSLTLDLLAREAFGHDKPLNLNPREFALLWRLTDNVGHPVPKQSLIQDVWRMGFVPETNSIAVHMSRLRRKLAFAGLAGMIETAPGGYCLRPVAENKAGDFDPDARKTAPRRSGRPSRRRKAAAATAEDSALARA